MGKAEGIENYWREKRKAKEAINCCRTKEAFRYDEGSVGC